MGLSNRIYLNGVLTYLFMADSVDEERSAVEALSNQAANLIGWDAEVHNSYHSSRDHIRGSALSLYFKPADGRSALQNRDAAKENLDHFLKVQFAHASCGPVDIIAGILRALDPSIDVPVETMFDLRTAHAPAVAA